MGGPDVDLLHLGVDQHRHDPVGRQRPRRQVGQRRISAHLGLVGKRGLVPMVPIGDVQPLARQERQEPVVRLDLRRGVQQSVDVAGAPLVGPCAGS